MRESKKEKKRKGKITTPMFTCLCGDARMGGLWIEKKQTNQLQFLDGKDNIFLGQVKSLKT